MNKLASFEFERRPSALGRRLGLWPAASLVVSSILGVGVFATAGQLASELGDARLILFTWVLVGAVFAMAGAAC